MHLLRALGAQQSRGVGSFPAPGKALGVQQVQCRHLPPASFSGVRPVHRTGPRAQEGPALGLTLRCRHLEILNDI